MSVSWKGVTAAKKTMLRITVAVVGEMIKALMSWAWMRLRAFWERRQKQHRAGAARQRHRRAQPCVRAQ
eukprot:2827697-Pleurochrysis_carterae.AAC.1